MAKYTMLGPDATIIVKLELEGWGPPDYWRDDNQIPEGFPIVTVDALILLFTRKRTHDAGIDGVEIPEVLGWHIATLIESWGGHLHRFWYDPSEYSAGLQTVQDKIMLDRPGLQPKDVEVSRASSSTKCRVSARRPSSATHSSGTRTGLPFARSTTRTKTEK